MRPRKFIEHGGNFVAQVNKTCYENVTKYAFSIFPIMENWCNVFVENQSVLDNINIKKVFEPSISPGTQEISTIFLQTLFTYCRLISKPLNI